MRRASAESELRRHYRGARLLLAEDNEVNREVALALLHGLGFAVDCAATGREAVALVRAGGYALVLMDMQMPEMNGVEATKVIRAMPGNAELPILALTANAFDEDRQACLAAGMNDFIAKPLDVQALQATLLRWLVSTQPPESAAPLPADHVDPPLPTRRFAGVPGLDLAQGLASVGGDQALFERALREFARADDLDRLRAALIAHDAAATQHAAHRLRGGASSMGFAEITEITLLIETQARRAAASGTAVADCTEQMTVLEATMAALREALDSP